MHHSAREIQTLLGRDTKHIVNKPVVEAAAALAGGEEFAQIKKHHLGILASDYITYQLFARNGSIVFRKYLAFLDMAENMATTPIKINDDVYTPRKNEPYLVYFIACTVN